MSARILVVEDNLANLELMTYLLRTFGYEVYSARDGVSGLALAQSTSFDLVLTDILMPELDGYQLVRRFKENPRLRDIPVIAVTALAMAGDRERILNSGFGGYISKPIDPRELAAQVRCALSKAALGDVSDR